MGTWDLRNLRVSIKDTLRQRVFYTLLPTYVNVFGKGDMLLSRIIVGDGLVVEGQAETKAGVEDALEAAYSVATRKRAYPPDAALNKVLHPDVIPHKAYREPETQAEELVTTPPPQKMPTAGGGDSRRRSVS